MEEAKPSGGSRSPWAYLRPYRAQVGLASLFLLMTSALALTIPQLLGRTVDALLAPNAAELVPPLATWMVVVAVLQACIRIASRILLFNSARMAEHNLRCELFGHLLRLDTLFYRTNPPGDLMSRLSNDVHTVRAMWGPGILNLVNTTFLYSVALFLMLRIDPVLTAWALLPYPAMAVFGVIYGRRIYRSSHGVQAELGSLSAAIQEDLTGVSIIKSYNIEQHRLAHFVERSTAVLDRNMQLTRVRGQLVPSMGAIAALSTVVVLYIGSGLVIEGHIKLGQLVEFNAYLAALVWPTLAMGWLISLLQRGRAAWSRLAEVLDTEASISDGPQRLDLDQVAGDLEIRELSLQIGGNQILRKLSLNIPAGSTTAIVGRTGAGKSALISALPRLHSVAPNTVFLDGRDITTLSLADLRAAIGYAPQEAFLFSATIAENIRFGVERRAHPPTTEEGWQAAILEAAEAAGLTRDLEALPEGLDTPVGERGITLSGGQRQRVALARALATQPRVLVLDDSLSSVDAETEQQILTHLEEAMEDRTLILISHRLAAVRTADQIAVIENGELAELGTHDELLAKKGLYTEIYETQLRKGIMA